jgi:hypothetical protein
VEEYEGLLLKKTAFAKAAIGNEVLLSLYQHLKPER